MNGFDINLSPSLLQEVKLDIRNSTYVLLFICFYDEIFYVRSKHVIIMGDNDMSPYLVEVKRLIFIIT
jgi:hypothetical protein